MKNIFFIVISFFYFSYNAAAENTVMKSGKYLTKTLENIIPFNLVKEIGKKITKVGGKEILFGATAAGILSEVDVLAADIALTSCGFCTFFSKANTAGLFTTIAGEDTF